MVFSYLKYNAYLLANTRVAEKSVNVIEYQNISDNEANVQMCILLQPILNKALATANNSEQLVI